MWDFKIGSNFVWSVRTLKMKKILGNLGRFLVVKKTSTEKKFFLSFTNCLHPVSFLDATEDMFMAFEIFYCIIWKLMLHGIFSFIFHVNLVFSSGKKRTILGKICIKGYGYCTSYIKGDPPKRFAFFTRWWHSCKCIIFFRYLRCCQLKRMGCKARAVQPLNSSEFFVLSQHNHPPDINEKNVYDFLVELRKLCQSGINLRLKDIYEQVAEW